MSSAVGLLFAALRANVRVILTVFVLSQFLTSSTAFVKKFASVRPT